MFFYKNFFLFLMLLIFTSLLFCSKKKEEKYKKEQIEEDKSPAIYLNPILPGFHPDPSIIRVNNDYYSTFSPYCNIDV